MGAAINGMALHGGLKVFGGTFFVFSDYLRPAIRLAAYGICRSHMYLHMIALLLEKMAQHMSQLNS